MQTEAEAVLVHLLVQALQLLNAIEDEHAIHKCPSCSEELDVLFENAHEVEAALMLFSARLRS